MRLAMARLAVEGEEGFEVSDIEARSEGDSYTIDTVLALREAIPHADFTFIIGSDLLRTLRLWKKFGELCQLVRFCCLLREGDSGLEAMSDMEKLNARFNAQFIFLEGETVAGLSSTAFRRGVLSREAGLKKQVLDYILQNHLFNT